MSNFANELKMSYVVVSAQNRTKIKRGERSEIYRAEWQPVLTVEALNGHTDLYVGDTGERKLQSIERATNEPEITGKRLKYMGIYVARSVT